MAITVHSIVSHNQHSLLIFFYRQTDLLWEKLAAT